MCAGLSVRRICVVVLSRANYGRCRTIIDTLHKRDDVELQLIVGASAVSQLHGNVAEKIESDGYEITEKIDFLLETISVANMASMTGLGLIRLASTFERLQPDVVVTIADRFETMATAIAAAYQNIRLAHVQGGEVTGSIDESVRHAITKLAHWHFPSSDTARKNIIRMGENAEFVFNFGCPAMDPLFTAAFDRQKPPVLHGVGAKIDLTERYLLTVFHPVTTKSTHEIEKVETIISALETLGKQVLWLWPNIDAGSDTVSKLLRQWREKTQLPVHFMKNLPIDDYNWVLKFAECAIGNSSSFIREGGVLGTPVVMIGDRQNQRERGHNVASGDFEDQKELALKIEQQCSSHYSSSTLYGSGDAGSQIAEVLAQETLPSIQKLLNFDD